MAWPASAASPSWRTSPILGRRQLERDRRDAFGIETAVDLLQPAGALGGEPRRNEEDERGGDLEDDESAAQAPAARLGRRLPTGPQEGGEVPRQAWRAGRRPLRRPVARATPRVKRRTRPSRRTWSASGVNWRAKATMGRVARRAKARPAIPPKRARPVLSVRSWRTRRRWLAPRAERSTISRSRIVWNSISPDRVRVCR